MAYMYFKNVSPAIMRTGIEGQCVALHTVLYDIASAIKYCDCDGRAAWGQAALPSQSQYFIAASIKPYNIRREDFAGGGESGRDFVSLLLKTTVAADLRKAKTPKKITWGFPESVLHGNKERFS